MTRPSPIARARSFAGFLAVIALLALIVYNVVATGQPWTTADRDIPLLISLIGALLGVDLLVEHRKALGEALVAGMRAYIESDSDQPSDDTATDDASEPTPPDE